MPSATAPPAPAPASPQPPHRQLRLPPARRARRGRERSFPAAPDGAAGGLRLHRSRLTRWGIGHNNNARVGLNLYPWLMEDTPSLGPRPLGHGPRQEQRPPRRSRAKRERRRGYADALPIPPAASVALAHDGHRQLSRRVLSSAGLFALGPPQRGTLAGLGRWWPWQWCVSRRSPGRAALSCAPGLFRSRTPGLPYQKRGAEVEPAPEPDRADSRPDRLRPDRRGAAQVFGRAQPGRRQDREA